VTVKQTAEKLRQTRRSANPRFVIEHEGKLFVTRALVEIDAGALEGRQGAEEQLAEIRHRLHSDRSAAKAARYVPGSGASAAERLLSGHVVTRGGVSEVDDGTSFAATNPPVQ
jgi:hypothetical protein